MKKRIVMAVLAAALGTALLAGCGGGQKAESRRDIDCIQLWRIYGSEDDTAV